ncbi:MAG: carboxypeptidase regulatory-like domain-containing protein [Methanobacteriota archaeon]
MKNTILIYGLIVLIILSQILCITPVVHAEKTLVVYAPESIAEQEQFTVTIKDTDGFTIFGVNVSFANTYNITGGTGTATFTAPSVDTDTEYQITATKPTYQTGTGNITVLNASGPDTILGELQIFLGFTHVPEETDFQIRILSGGNLAHNTTILFNNQEYLVADGVLILSTPLVDRDTNFSIRAQKPHYQEGIAWIKVTNNETEPTRNQLQITAPSSVTEGKLFQVNITANNTPIHEATVLFMGSPHITDPDGRVFLTAPLIEENTIYPISASKNTYEGTTTYIWVLNQEEPSNNNSWIYGVITSNQQIPIKDAIVCAQQTGEPTETCTTTDEEGKYVLSISPGYYQVTVRKQPYMTTAAHDILVQQNTAYELIFKLVSTNDSDHDKQYLIDYAITQIKNDGNVFGEIRVQDSENHFITQTQTYDNTSRINITSATNHSLSITINGSQNLSGDILIIRFDPLTLENIQNISVEYDHALINEVTIDELLNAENTMGAIWASVAIPESQGNTSLYVLLKVTLSTHTIAISSISEAIPEGLMPFTEITIISAIIIVCFAAIIMFRKNKEP